MRAITDWYFTAHPPIMHDLHESLSLLYTYSGGPPQNPNLDPLLFGELRFFANWELSQMTKWGMPGVYTHAFMDGWSPGYLGSVAYNHNGMMRMYETQSGRDVDPTRAPAGAGGRWWGAATVGWRRGGRGRRRSAGDTTAVAGGAPAGGGGGGGGGPRWRRCGSAHGRGGGQDARVVPRHPGPGGRRRNFTRRNNANYMQTGVLSALQLTAMFPKLVLENFYVKTRNSHRARPHGARPRVRDPRAARHDQGGRADRILRARGSRSGRCARDQGRRRTRTRPARTSSSSTSRTGASPRTCSRSRTTPTPALRTYDDSGWTMGLAFNVTCIEIATAAILARHDAGHQVRCAAHRRQRHGRAGRGAPGLEQHDHASATVCGTAVRVARRPSRPRAWSSRRGRSCDGQRCSCARPARPSTALGLTGRSASRARRSQPRRRPAAHRHLLQVERHAGARLVPPRLRPVRHPVRPDLQGAGQAGEPGGRSTT
jgi:hypothetical protein